VKGIGKEDEGEGVSGVGIRGEIKGILRRFYHPQVNSYKTAKLTGNIAPEGGTRAEKRPTVKG